MRHSHALFLACVLGCGARGDATKALPSADEALPGAAEAPPPPSEAPPVNQPGPASDQEIGEAVRSLLGDQPFIVHLTDTDAYAFAERNEIAEGGGQILTLVVDSNAAKREEHEVEDEAAAKAWLTRRLRGRVLRRVPGTQWPDGGKKLDLGEAGVVLFDGYGTLTFPGGKELDLGNEDYGVRPDKVFADGQIVGTLVRELSPADQAVYMYLLRSIEARE